MFGYYQAIEELPGVMTDDSSGEVIQDHRYRALSGRVFMIMQMQNARRNHV